MKITDDFGNDTVTFWQEEKKICDRDVYPWTQYVYYFFPEYCDISWS